MPAATDTEPDVTALDRPEPDIDMDGPTTEVEGAPPAAPDLPDDLVTISVAADLAGKTDRTVRRWVSNGELRHWEVDGQRMVSRADVTAKGPSVSGPSADGDRTSPGAGLVPVSELGPLFDAVAEAGRARAGDAERAGRAEERESFERRQRQEAEAERDRLRAELRDAVAARDNATAEADRLRLELAECRAAAASTPRRRWGRSG